MSTARILNNRSEIGPRLIHNYGTIIVWIYGNVLCESYQTSTYTHDVTYVCGFMSTDAIAFSRAHFGAGTGTIHLDNVDCSGSENNLIDCPRSSFVSCSGGHSKDAGVRCRG